MTTKINTLVILFMGLALIVGIIMAKDVAAEQKSPGQTELSSGCTRDLVEDCPHPAVIQKGHDSGCTRTQVLPGPKGCPAQDQADQGELTKQEILRQSA